MNEKWEVVITKGESEPWWFFEGWEESIIESYIFYDREHALSKYEDVFKDFSSQFDKYKIKKSTICAFWNEGEYLFCDHCDDDLQVFYGLFIMYNDKPYVDVETNNNLGDSG